MKRNVMLLCAAGLALGVSLGAAQAATPMFAATPNSYAAAAVTPVSHNIAQCRQEYRACYRACGRHSNLKARRNCIDRCTRAYARCWRH